MKQNPQKQKKMEMMLNQAINALKVGIYKWEKDNPDMCISESLFRLLGYEPDYSPGAMDFLISRIHKDDYEKIVKGKEQTINISDNYFQQRLRIRDKNDEWRWWENRFIITEKKHGKSQKAFGIVYDITDRINLEDIFSNLVSNIDDGIVILEDGKPTFISDRASEIFGYPEEELMKMTAIDVAAPADKEKLKRLYGDAKNDLKIPTIINFEIITKAGERKFISNRYYRYSDVPGKIKWYILTTDLTEIKNYEYKLFKTEKKISDIYRLMRLMTDNLPDLLWAKDLEKKFLFVNKAMCNKLLNAKNTDEPIGKDDIFFAVRGKASHPDNPRYHTFGEICVNSDDIILKSKKPGRFEEFGYVKNEFLFLDVNKSPIFDEKGNIIGIVGSARDVTKEKLLEEEHRKAEKSLLENESRLKLATKISGIGMWEWYIKEDKLILDDKLTELFDLEENTVINGSISGLLIHPQDKKSMIELIDNSISNKSEFEIEYRIITRKGNIKYLKLHGTVLTDEYSEPVKLIGLCWDVSETKYREAELETAKEEAERANRAKSAFLSNISHELRTPLMGILGFTELLGAKLDDAESLEMIKYIEDSGYRLKETLDSLLDLATIEANKVDVNFREFSINKVIEDIISKYYDKIISKNLELITNIFSEEITLFSDAKLITQITGRILDNAIKYTNHGSIKIEMLYVTNDNVNQIKISVKDTGIGIAEEYHSLIFEPFRQVSEGYSRVFEGIGLGLSIAKKYADAIGGTISLTSKVNKGSTFMLSLPVIHKTDILQDDEDELTVEDYKKELNNKPVKEILLVEDERINSSFIINILKNDFNVDAAVSGEEAIRKCGVKLYDIILLDISLGKGITGLEALKIIREFKGYRNIPVIAVTAHALEGQKEEFIKKGCTHYIPKPFRRKELLALLNGL